MYFLYSLGGVTFNKCWITLSILNCYSPNFQGFILMNNALNNQVGMLGYMFLWLVANLKQGVIYFIKQALPPKQISRECSSFNFHQCREVRFPDLDLILISLIFNYKSWSSNQENLILKSWFPDLQSIHQIKSWSSRKPDFQENLIFKYRFPDLTLN